MIDRLAAISPRWFLTLYAAIGMGFLFGARWLALPGLSLFALIAGVILAALWHPRWVYGTSIVLYELLALPLLVDLQLSPRALLLFYGLSPLGFLALTEVIAHLVTRLRLTSQRETAAKLRLDQILLRNPSVLYGLTPAPDGGAEFRLSFASDNAQVILGSAPETRLPGTTGLCGRLSEPESVAWRDALQQAGEATVEYPFVHPTGRRLWLRDTSRWVRDETSGVVEVVGHVVDVSSEHRIAAQLDAQERRLSTIVRHSPAVLFHSVRDPEQALGWRMVFVSTNVLEVTGYSADDLSLEPDSWFRHIHPEDRAQVIEASQRAAQSLSAGAPITYTYRFECKDGRQIWFQDTLQVLLNAQGQPQELYGHGLDITAQRRTAELAEEGRQIQDESVRNSPAILLRALPAPEAADAWHFVYHSANTLDVLGYFVEEIEADPDLWLTRIHPDDLARVLTAARHLAAAGPSDPMPVVYDYRFQHRAGHWIWIQDVQRVVFDAAGQASALYGQSVDVNARRQAEQALAASQHELEEVVHNSPAVLFHARPDPQATDGLRYVYHSANVTDCTGLTPVDIEHGNEGWLRQIHPEDRPGFIAETRAFVLGTSPSTAPLIHTYRFRRGDGTEIWLQDTLRAVRDAEGQVLSVTGQNLDVTVTQQAIEALRTTEARLQHIVRNSPLATYSQEVRVPGEKPVTTFVSDNIRDLTGYSADALLADKALWRSRIHLEDWERVQVAEEHGATTAEYRLRRKDGVEIWLEDTWQAVRTLHGEVAEYIGEIQDITARRRAQIQAEESQHFINQLASAIPSQVFVADLTHQQIVYVNRIHPEVMHYPFTQTAGTDLIAVLGQDIHPDDQAHYAETIARVAELANGAILSADFRVRAQAGDWRDLHFHYRVFRRDPQGVPTQLLVVWDDVTPARQAERRLAENERLLSRMADALPNTTYILDLAAMGGPGAFVYANHYLADVLGYAALEPDQREDVGFLLRILHPDDQSEWLAQVARIPALQDQQVLEQDYRLRAADGTWRWVHSRIQVFLRDEAGAVRQILGVIDDTTALHQAQAELADSQRLLSRVAQAVPSVLYVVDLEHVETNGGIRYANRSLSALLGYPEALIQEQGWARFIQEHLHPEGLKHLATAPRRWLDLPDGEVLETEYRLRAADDSWRWVRNRDLVFERDAQGQVTQVIGVLEDITASRDLQQVIETQRDFAHLVLNSLGQGVAVFNTIGLCEYINPAGARILGLEAGVSIGSDWGGSLDPAVYQKLLEQWRQGATFDSTHTLEMTVRHRDGTATDLLVTGAPRLQGGERTGWVMVFSDVTERNALSRALTATNHELEKALDTARELTREAQAATRAKSDFLANMSHEIRTPMNAIVGMAELLLETEQTEEQQSQVQVMVDSGQALLQIINDILDFSKIEARRVELDPHAFSLTALVEGVTELLVAQAASQGLHLASFVDPAIPDPLIGDSGRLRQVLLNLLSNAVKFTRAGRVVVRADLASLSEHTAHIRLSVQDTGIGITPETQARLFQPFEQAEASTTRRYGGTGLGLALVRRLTDLMGGAVTLSSAPGSGTTVTVDLALPLVTRQVASAPTRSGCVWVIDPNPIEGEILNRYLTAEGYACQTFTDPASVGGQRPPGLEPVALIVGLWPATNDLEPLLVRVATDPTLGRVPRIVISETTRAAAGGECRLARPIRREGLRAGLDRATQQDCRAPDPSVVTQPVVVERPSVRRRVLLAEDNLVNQRVARLQLDKLGYEVDVVADGAAAVLAYAGDPAGYDRILMDCQMPVVDGFEATKQIRAWEAGQGAGRHVHIIAMTANAMAGDREECLAVGMDDYLSKPVSRQALTEAMARSRPAGAATE